MENKFIPDAIEIVSKAITADNEGEYEKALNLYRDALGRFTMGLKYGKSKDKMLQCITTAKFSHFMLFHLSSNNFIYFSILFRKKCSKEKTHIGKSGRIYEKS